MQVRNQLSPIQEKWIAALEGGYFKQNTGGHLYDNQCYCCLGVATYLVDPDHTSLANDGWEREDWTDMELVANDPEWFNGLVDGSVASPDIAVALQLHGTDGKFRFAARCKGRHSLAELNDAGESFADIAAFICASPWLVFTNFDMPKAEVKL